MTIPLPKHPLAQWVAASLTAGTVAFGSAAFAAGAMPLAGTEIKNLATVSYEDENGNTYTAQSNEAIITVAPVYYATLTNDRTLSGAPGQTVYFPHKLSNTGNITDTYNLAADNGASVYIDTNGNGQPDAGELVSPTVTLAPDEVVDLIVAYTIPVTATAATPDKTVTLTVTSTNSGTVYDIGGNADATNGTNQDIVKVETGPILVNTKSASMNAAGDRITYTLTVKNTGGSDATGVKIIDALPSVDTDGDGTIDQQVTLDTGTIVASGLLDTNGDNIPGTNTAETVVLNETIVGWDVNNDGDMLDTNVEAVSATDATLPANTTVSIQFTVVVDPNWNAGTEIRNEFVSFEDPDNDNQPPVGEDPVPSNETLNVIDQTYGVMAEDDGTGSGTGDGNDGTDDDSAANNDVQLVDEVSAGDIVLFTHTITNNGNGDDSFNLGIDTAADTFPPGTTFTFWSADGSTPLTDDDGDGQPDTPILGQGEFTQIMIKADLPAGYDDTNSTAPYTATLTATSVGDETMSDDTTLTLASITPPAVDLSAIGAGQPNTGFNDAGIEDAHDEGPVLLADGVVGGTVTFPMSVANESGSSDTFLLSESNVPAGWTVVYKDGAGNAITSTPLLAPGGTFDFTAEVTVSSNPAEAWGDSPRAGDVDGTDNSNNASATVTPDANQDGDADYQITFTATSATSSARTDDIIHAVDVAPSKQVQVTPDGQNQIQPGGTVDYPHTVTNSGNEPEVLELTATNTDPNWTSTIKIDTDGDGVPDTEINNATTVTVYNPDGTTIQVPVTPGTDGDGKVEIPLDPGQYVKITNTVFAPSDAPQGAVNTTTITATDTDDTPREVAEDTSTVVLGQVRLDKTVALDELCDGTLESGFLPIQTDQVKPGDCAVWEIVATNEGDALVKNVVVSDSIPTYTAYQSPTLQYCLGFNCDPTTGGVTDAASDDAGEYDGVDKVTFWVGTNATPGTEGGELQPGQSATVRFSVKVDE